MTSANFNQMTLAAVLVKDDDLAKPLASFPQ
jgi:hypothetical protein